MNKTERARRLAKAGRAVRGGWTMPVPDESWFGKMRDSIAWRIMALGLLLGTRWYREFITGAIALGMDTAQERAEAEEK